MKCKPIDPYPVRYFFDAGIHFECTRCGACCTGDPGVVRISGQEIRLLADFLHMAVADLIQTHLRPIETGFSIDENPDGGCRFFDGGCRIYPVRPLQCRTYPFWFSLMRSRENWEKAVRACPGIGNGPLHPREEILSRLCESIDSISKTVDPLDAMS